jgi:hypothetical protein
MCNQLGRIAIEPNVPGQGKVRQIDCLDGSGLLIGHERITREPGSFLSAARGCERDTTRRECAPCQHARFILAFQHPNRMPTWYFGPSAIPRRSAPQLRRNACGSH